MDYNVLEDLKKNNLIGKYGQKVEAYIPDDKTNGEPAEPNDPNDTPQKVPGEQGTAPSPELDQERHEIEKEVYELVMKIHKLSSKAIGLLSDDIGGHGTNESVEPAVKSDVTSVIKELIATTWSASPEQAGKAIELMKGLVFSDDPKARSFLKKMDEFSSTLKIEEL